MASNPVPAQNHREPAVRPVLYAFTLRSHYERSLGSEAGPYTLPGGKTPPFAHSFEELRQQMDNFNPSPFEERDRESDGLVLVLNRERLRTEGARRPGIPREAIEETLVAPRRLVFEMPGKLSQSPVAPEDFQTQLRLALAGMWQMLPFGIILGFFLAAFSRGIPLEVTSQWFGYFLSQDNFLVIWIVAGLFSISLLYLISSARKRRSSAEHEPGGSGWLQSALQIGRALDFVPEGLSMGWRVFSMIAFFILGVTAILVWYRSAPTLAPEFLLERTGQAPLSLAPYQVVELSPQESVTLQVRLPPPSQEAECRWSTASSLSGINPLPGCRAVYHAPETSGGDQIVVEFYRNGQRLGDAPLNVRVP